MQQWQKYKTNKQDHDYAMVADLISVINFDAKNAPRLPTSVTKQHKVIDFAINKQHTHYY